MSNIRVGSASNSIIIGGDVHGTVSFGHNASDQFEPLRRTLLEKLPSEDRQRLLAALGQLEHAQKPAEITERYNAFVQAAANHMTLLQPLIPSLVDLLR